MINKIIERVRPYGRVRYMDGLIAVTLLEKKNTFQSERGRMHWFNFLKIVDLGKNLVKI